MTTARELRTPNPAWLSSTDGENLVEVLPVDY
jgi:hypothetical protein